jgi:hypothetical protein
MQLVALLLSTRYEGEDLLGVFASTELAEAAAQEYLKNRGVELSKMESFVYMEVELNKLR